MESNLAAGVPLLAGIASDQVSDLSPSLNGAGGEETSSSPAHLTGYNASEARDWIALLKPRVMSLVVFSGAIGLMVAPGHLHLVLAFTAVLCIAIGAGACGAINM